MGHVYNKEIESKNEEENKQKHDVDPYNPQVRIEDFERAFEINRRENEGLARALEINRRQNEELERELEASKKESEELIVRIRESKQEAKELKKQLEKENSWLVCKQERLKNVRIEAAKLGINTIIKAENDLEVFFEDTKAQKKAREGNDSYQKYLKETCAELEKENKELKKENKELKKENAILKMTSSLTTSRGKIAATLIASGIVEIDERYDQKIDQGRIEANKGQQK